MRLRGGALCSIALVGLLACSSDNLQPVEQQRPAGADNLLRLTGDFCVDAPEQASYPVKILFVIDASGSMQFTDPQKNVQVAVRQVIDRLKSNPSVRFAVISFNGVVRINSADPTKGDNSFDHVSSLNLGRNAGFFPGTQLPPGTLDGITIRDTVTDYQGALGAAYRLLEQDMLASSPGERTRSKYVILFLSDGWPNPQCNSDCMNANAQPVCVDRRTLPAEAKDSFPELKVCQDYNLPYQIYAKVDQIMRLRTAYSVGDMRLHTVWLRDPNDRVSTGLGYKPEDAKELLQKMAVEHGSGTFSDYNSGEQVSFARVDYASILRPYGLAQLLAWNLNALPTPSGYVPDTDGDGLSDAQEGELGTKPTVADTDEDGYDDNFEQQRLDRGFDPKSASRPWFKCLEKDRVDLDGDGLKNCEEAVIGTDPRLTDSDGDHVPDGLEVRFRTNPLLPDDTLDSDADGVLNLQEFVAQTDPQVADTTLYRDARTAYSITDQGEVFGQSRCYRYAASQVSLAPTLGAKGSAGRNRVMLYFGQAPRDAGENDPGRWRLACFDAVWAPPFKLPVTGEALLTPKDLRDAATFDPRLHCQLAVASGMP